MTILFFISIFIIFWAMIGYPLSLILIDKILPVKENLQNSIEDYPTVTLLIVAHNEQKVIESKLENVINLVYPKDKIEILISSDNSTDSTNEIVENFISKHPEYNIRLYCTKERMGKTNAQNEAQKTVNSEFLVMTDANSIIDQNAITELMKSFSSDEIAYVTGRLIYVNSEKSISSSSENNYWNLDIKMRDIESRLQTITAGNGALYACRNSEYVDFDPIKSHDSSMPLHYALHNKRAIMNKHAIVYEKAGETIEDEFSRKVRMNRILLSHIIPNLNIFNVFRYKWFSYFYFGHRTCRYLLWISHLTFLVTSMLLMNNNLIYKLIIICHVLLAITLVLKKKLNLNIKLINLVYYYCLTVKAQWLGVYNTIRGKSKSTWEKAESTR